MGADMLLYYCPALVNADGSMVELSVLETVVAERVAALTDDAIDAIKKELDDESFEEQTEFWESQLTPGVPGDIPDLATLRSDFRKALVDAAMEIRPGYRRDVTIMRPETRLFLASGGPSWGDEPTDACQLINLVAVAGIFDEPVS